jgi:hypothetical protein
VAVRQQAHDATASPTFYRNTRSTHRNSRAMTIP